jgi:hypothetical protein
LEANEDSDHSVADFVIIVKLFEMIQLLALILLASILVVATARRRRNVNFSQSNGLSAKAPTEVKDDNPSDGNGSKPTIEPLPDFDWQATPPTKLRPFKPTYNITMGVSRFTCT